MKTAEQILKEYWPELQDGSIRKRIIEAMQLYSDQQNKELREKVKMWEETADRSFRSYVEENQRLTKEVERLENMVAELTFGLTAGSDENTRLRELLQRAEPQLNNFLIEMLPVEMESTKQLLKDIDNALNHKS